MCPNDDAWALFLYGSPSPAERASLAKELHDELGGLITAAKMDLAWLSTRIGASLDAESGEKLNSVMQMLNQAMLLKRRVVESLRPSPLDHFGLSVALRSHFDEHCKRAGVECVLRQRGKLDQRSAIFYDLAVPAGAKVTSIQEGAEAEPANDEPGEEDDAPEAPPKGP